MSQFIIILSGRLKANKSPDQAAVILSKVYGIPAEKGRALFQGKPVPLRKKLKKELAEKLCKHLQDAGAECRMEIVQETSELSLDPAPDSQRTAKVDRFDTDNSTSSPVVEKSVEEARPTSIPASSSDSIVISDRVDGFVVPDQPASELTQAPEVDNDRNKGIENRGVSKLNKPVGFQYVKEVEDEEVEEAKGVEKYLQQLTPQMRIIAGAGAAVIVIALLLVMLWPSEPEPLVVTKSKPQKTNNSQQVKKRMENDPFMRESEISFTKLKLKSLTRSIRVWMLEFGGGYDPKQVTMSRLQVDMGVSDADLTDAWGTAIRYKAIEKSFVVVSAGPDKKFDSKDDIKRTSTQ